MHTERGRGGKVAFAMRSASNETFEVTSPPGSEVVFVNEMSPPAVGASGVLLNELVSALGVHSRAPGVRVQQRSGKRPGTVGQLAVEFAGTMSLGLKLCRADAKLIVLMTNPHLLPLLAHSARVPVVHWVMDVYPDIAEVLGVVPRSVSRGIAKPMRTARAGAAANVAIGRCMADLLRAQGAANVRVVPNWAPPDVSPQPRSPNLFREQYEWGDTFVVMYAGHFGRAHPVEGVLDAARRLKDQDAVRFVIAGGGPKWKVLRERATPNVKFIPAVPRERLSDLLAAADLHLVVQDERTLGMLVPSKIYGALASGRPVAFLGPAAGEAGLLAAASPWGRVFPSREGSRLAEWIRALAEDPPELPVEHGVAIPTVEDAADAFSALFEEILDARVR